MYKHKQKNDKASFRTYQ